MQRKPIMVRRKGMKNSQAALQFAKVTECVVYRQWIFFFGCCTPEHHCVTMMPVTSDTSLDERLCYKHQQLEEVMLMLCLLMQADDFNGVTVQSQSLAQREDESLLSAPPPAVPEVIVKLFLFCVRCLNGGLSTVLFHGSGSVNEPATMIYHSIDLTNEKT